MTVSGLTPGFTYAFSLSAGNAVGYGPAVKFRVTTLPEQKPVKQQHTDTGNNSTTLRLQGGPKNGATLSYGLQL